MKFADSVPFYVRERVQREVRKKRDFSETDWMSKLEHWLVGSSRPLVEGPFVPCSVINGASTPAAENTRRQAMKEQRVLGNSIIVATPDQTFSHYPEIVKEFQQGGFFDDVHVSVPLLDGSGRMVELPKILRVTLTQLDGSFLTEPIVFDSTSNPDTVSQLRLNLMFPLKYIGAHPASDVLEDLSGMDHVIRVIGDNDQTSRLKSHISVMLNEAGFTIKKVLVVNDHELAKLLESLGFEVVVSDNNAAIDQLKTNKFDLLIADAALPNGIQGFELMGVAKTANSLIKTILFSITTDTRLSHDKLIDGYVNRNAGHGELLGMIDLLACD